MLSRGPRIPSGAPAVYITRLSVFKLYIRWQFFSEPSAGYTVTPVTCDCLFDRVIELSVQSVQTH